MDIRDKLEFNLFLSKLKKYSFSQYGKSYIDNLQYSDNPEFDYNLIKDIVRILSQKDEILNLVYVDDILQKLKTNVLEASEILRLKNYFEGIETIKNFIFSNEDLSLFFSEFMDYSSIIKKINSVLTQDGKIKDDASEDLKTVRKQLKQIKRELKSKTERILNKYSPYLQERMITFRNSRIVLPFKASFKNRVNGVVQDISSTGATIFIEPSELVTLNNDIRSLESKERYEIIKILTSISYRIRSFLDRILNDQDLLSFFDSLYARAVYLVNENCVIPDINTNSYIKIKNARNPLIHPDSVVPLDFEIGKENDIVIITGPNTGGKTVTLKTIGLFSLMVKMAIPIPADYANLPIFDNIFVDIGDEQAVQQNLSTFSSHMKNIVQALNNLDRSTLILFDELGAGTDPMEGSALAIAIVDYLLQKNVRAVITTHYNELKLYAYSKPNIENASMQFDINTLKPTYRLLMGIPGSSNAFEIAKRLGMKMEIIEKARQFKGKEYEDMDKIINEIHKEKTSVLNEKERVLNTKKELELKMYQYDSLIEKVKKDGIKSINKDYEKLKVMKKEIEEMVSRAKKSFDLYELKKTNKKLQTFLKEVKDFELKEQEPANSFGPQNINVGDVVELFSSKGRVLKIDGNKAKIDINGVILESNISKLKKISQNNILQNDNEELSVSYTKTSFSSRIDLRGFRAEDALEAVEHFIYELKSSDFRYGTIVHGKGTGALMMAIHDYLRSNKEVKSFRLGMPEEGGGGVTVIEV